VAEQERERELAAWIISAAGQEITREFTAEVEIAGWEERPWVKLRPLTAREALRRESLGTRDEYEVRADGNTALVKRTYDLEAMTEYDLDCCLVDFVLPVQGQDGEVRGVRMGDDEFAADGSLLDRLPPALAGWLIEAIEAVNLRRRQDGSILSDTKKGCEPQRIDTRIPESSPKPR